MMEDKLFTIEKICKIYKIKPDFVNELIEFELITIVSIEKTDYVDVESFSDLEKMIRLHNDLGINVQGIDAILHLQRKHRELRKKINRLEAKLRLYE
ncbi:chaperone modulator CbpM [Aureivirga sp. CE67]|uniref:chaperone modulator CbpM n=1 Tax=Aureivirga sp. CE67 TaxID=1788983 RepID=UPI0018C8DCEE|nr:chaperone modulator CbpM [Aureivirga sp. CE67]